MGKSATLTGAGVARGPNVTTVLIVGERVGDRVDATGDGEGGGVSMIAEVDGGNVMTRNGDELGALLEVGRGVPTAIS